MADQDPSSPPLGQEVGESLESTSPLSTLSLDSASSAKSVGDGDDWALEWRWEEKERKMRSALVLFEKYNSWEFVFETFSKAGCKSTSLRYIS